MLYCCPQGPRHQSPFMRKGKEKRFLGKTWRVPLSLLYSFCDDQEENSALLGRGLTSRDHRDGRILFQVF